MKNIYIVGAGGLGREVSWLIERINDNTPTWNIKGFIDDNKSIWGKQIDGYFVLGGCDYFGQLHDTFYVVCAIASVKAREQLYKRIDLFPNVQYATVVDPDVKMSKYVKLGKDVIICAGTIITVDIMIGNHVIIDLDCTIGHDAQIGDNVTLYPSVNVSGKTKFEGNIELGTGVQVIQGVSIGKNTIVGAGAVVINNLSGNCVAVGIPARPIKPF